MWLRPRPTPSDLLSPLSRGYLSQAHPLRLPQLRGPPRLPVRESHPISIKPQQERQPCFCLGLLKHSAVAEVEWLPYTVKNQIRLGISVLMERNHFSQVWASVHPAGTSNRGCTQLPACVDTMPYALYPLSMESWRSTVVHSRLCP